MTTTQRMLLETLAGHFAWLKSAHPRKANSPLARRAKRAVDQGLRIVAPPPRMRKAA